MTAFVWIMLGFVAFVGVVGFLALLLSVFLMAAERWG